MATVKQHLDAARKILTETGIETAALDARLLLQQVLGKSMEELLLSGDVSVDTQNEQIFQKFVARRASHEPVAKIIGKKEFYGRDFITTADTLDPRPDSEALVEAVLNTFSNKKDARVLDIGTGTGCLLLSLLGERESWSGTGVDVSQAALAVAQRNAINLALNTRANFNQSNCFDSVAGLFDVIVSNPPYIAEEEKAELERDVIDYEPHIALFASEDGLYFYRHICEQASRFLSSGGWLFFEVGHTQAASVETLMKKNGFSMLGKKKDLSGVYRVVYGCCQK